MRYSILLYLSLSICIACGSGKSLQISQDTYKVLNEKMPSIKHEQELKKFLGEIKKDVETHNWGNIFAKSSKKHYLTQFKLGIKPPQYAAEILDLHKVGNNIVSNDKKVEYEDINKIQKVDFQTISFGETEKSIVVTGKTTLNDKSKLNVTLFIEVIDGKYALTGAVG
ncbi:MAG: hypothetical protein ACPG5B_11305 [Chitinophagales bacterium]